MENAEIILKELAMMIDEELQTSMTVWLKDTTPDGKIIFTPLSVHVISKEMADKSRKILRGS
jgi:hypothetical protein